MFPQIKLKSKYQIMIPWFLFFLSLAVIVFLCIKLAQVPKTSDQAAQNEINQLVSSVSKLVVLPTDETPTIATVTDTNALKGQPFFENAKVGDKILIYIKAQKAILFDPSEDKVVEIAPIDTSEISTTTATAATPKGN